jgi:hypothetical protein
MSTFARSEVIKLMGRVGMRDAIPDALATLPDPVDTDRDSAALEKLGLSRGHLMEVLGSGP